MLTRRLSKILLSVLAHNGCYFNFVFCGVFLLILFIVVQFNLFYFTWYLILYTSKMMQLFEEIGWI